MDAFELLKKDHKKVSQLFKEIEAASGQTKKQIFSRLKNELDVHAQVEERIFYPALENKEVAREITLEAYEEHKVVKDLLGELANGNAPDDEWDAKLTVLKENVEHHVDEEEGELFSKARQALTSDEIEELGAEMEAAKANQQGELTQAKAPARSSGEVNKASKTSNKRAKQKESPGVLQRLANLVGLGDSGSSKATGKAPAKRPSKATKTGGKKAAKTAAKKSSKGTSKTRSSKTSKKAAKTSSGSSTNASRSRGAAKKPATRRSGAKKPQGRAGKKRSR